jgi:hypothetical protein
MKKIASAIIVASMLIIGSVSADTYWKINENHMEEKNEINSEYKENKKEIKLFLMIYNRIHKIN